MCSGKIWFYIYIHFSGCVCVCVFNTFGIQAIYGLSEAHFSTQMSLYVEQNGCGNSERRKWRPCAKDPKPFSLHAYENENERTTLSINFHWIALRLSFSLCLSVGWSTKNQNSSKLREKKGILNNNLLRNWSCCWVLNQWKNKRTLELSRTTH